MKRHLPGLLQRTRLEIAFTCPTLACCTTSNRHEFCNSPVQAPGLRVAIAWPVSAMGCLVDQTLALGRDVTVSMARLSFWSPKGIPKETHAHKHTPYMAPSTSSQSPPSSLPSSWDIRSYRSYTLNVLGLGETKGQLRPLRGLICGLVISCCRG